MATGGFLARLALVLYECQHDDRSSCLKSACFFGRDKSDAGFSSSTHAYPRRAGLLRSTGLQYRQKSAMEPCRCRDSQWWWSWMYGHSFCIHAPRTTHNCFRLLLNSTILYDVHIVLSFFLAEISASQPENYSNSLSTKNNSGSILECPKILNLIWKREALVKSPIPKTVQLGENIPVKWCIYVLTTSCESLHGQKTAC